MPEPTSSAAIASAVPGQPVTVPIPDRTTTPGDTVAVTVVPPSGPIPATVAIVAAPVVDWFDSTRMRLALVGVASAALDAGWNVALPVLESFLTSGKPLDWRALLVAVLRPAGTAALSAAFAYFTKTSNQVVR